MGDRGGRGEARVERRGREEGRGEGLSVCAPCFVCLPMDEHERCLMHVRRERLCLVAPVSACARVHGLL